MADSHFAGYDVVISHAVFESEVSPSAKLLWGLLRGLSVQRGYCWATNKHLARRIDASVPTVQRLLRELQAAKHIAVDLDPHRQSEQRRIYTAQAEVASRAGDVDDHDPPPPHVYQGDEEGSERGASKSTRPRVISETGPGVESEPPQKCIKAEGGHKGKPPFSPDVAEGPERAGETGPDPSPSHQPDGDLFADAEAVDAEEIPDGEPGPDQDAGARERTHGELAALAALWLFDQLRELGVVHVVRAHDAGKREASLAAWSREFDRLVRIDGHSWHDVGEVLTWLVKVDGWWIAQGNFQTALKLRQKDREGATYFDRFLQRARAAKAAQLPSPDASDPFAAAAL